MTKPSAIHSCLSQKVPTSVSVGWTQTQSMEGRFELHRLANLTKETVATHTRYSAHPITPACITELYSESAFRAVAVDQKSNDDHPA